MKSASLVLVQGGAKLKAHREALGLTQAEVAERAGWARSRVAAFENASIDGDIGIMKIVRLLHEVGLQLRIDVVNEPASDARAVYARQLVSNLHRSMKDHNRRSDRAKLDSGRVSIDELSGRNSFLDGRRIDADIPLFESPEI